MRKEYFLELIFTIKKAKKKKICGTYNLQLFFATNVLTQGTISKILCIRQLSLLPATFVTHYFPKINTWAALISWKVSSP